MHVGDLLRYGNLVAREFDSWVQGDPGHEKLAVLVLGHDPERLVLVGIDDEALLGGNRQEGQHVAAGDGRHEGLFRIDGILPRERQRHDGRRCGARHFDAAIEAPGVAAAVAVVGEGLVRSAHPANCCLVFVRHCRVLVQEIDFTNSWYCSSVMRPSSSLWSVRRIFMNQPRPAGSSLTVPGEDSRSLLTSTTSPETGA